MSIVLSATINLLIPSLYLPSSWLTCTLPSVHSYVILTQLTAVNSAPNPCHTIMLYVITTGMPSEMVQS